MLRYTLQFQLAGQTMEASLQEALSPLLTLEPVTGPRNQAHDQSSHRKCKPTPPHYPWNHLTEFYCTARRSFPF